MFALLSLKLLPIFLGDIFGIFETLQEMDFVVRVLVFSYLIYQMYLTFMPYKAELLFGLTAIVSGYFVFAHGLSTAIIVLLFVLFVVMGMYIQQLIQFGLLPLLGYHYNFGDKFTSAKEAEAAESQSQNAAMRMRMMH